MQDLKRYENEVAKQEAKEQTAFNNAIYHLGHDVTTAEIWGWLHDDDDYLLANLVGLFIQEYYTHQPHDRLKREAVEVAIGRAVRKHIEKLAFDEQLDIVNDE